MKYFIIFIIIVVYFFPKSFVTYPGYTTKEIYDAWDTNEKKHCYGFTYTPVKELADSEEKSFCFGIPL